MSFWNNNKNIKEEISIDNTGNPNLIVSVRVRPENEKELSGNYQKIVKVLDEHIIIFDPLNPSTKTGGRLNGKKTTFTSNFHKARDYKYAFDRVFDENSTQQEVYENTTRPLIECVMNGFNATVFAYGATGSGKTHTMIGNEKSGPGVMVLTMRDLFKCIEENKFDKKYQISITYLEVYNETIRDLFIPNSSPLKLCEDPDKGVCVSGLTEKFPKTPEEVFELLEYGNSNRIQAFTTANAVSSRSHAVLQIYVEQRDKTPGINTSIKIGKFSLIDLAGSERACVSQNRGDRMKEGANINRSLLALGNCINSLGENYKKGKHVPYRNSKLTRLLKDSLGGNCKTVMIANISPSSLSYEDTLNTLKYANRAKNIKTKITRNVINVDYHISKYTDIINELRNEVMELKNKLQQQQPSYYEINNSINNLELEENKKKINKLEENIIKMKEIMKEQYKILLENNLLNEQLIHDYNNAIQLNNSPIIKKNGLPLKTNLKTPPTRILLPSDNKELNDKQFSKDLLKNDSFQRQKENKNEENNIKPKSILKIKKVELYPDLVRKNNSPTFKKNLTKSVVFAPSPIKFSNTDNINENVIEKKKFSPFDKNQMKKRGHFSFMNATIASKDKIKSPNKKFKRSLSLPLGNIKYSRT